VTCRERVLASINHREPEKLPVDLGGTGGTTLTAGAYVKLRNALSLPPKQPVFTNRYAQIVEIDEDVLKQFEIDTRGVYPLPGENWAFTEKEKGEYKISRDEWGVGYRMPLEGGRYYDLFDYPLQGKAEKDILTYQFPKGDDTARVEGLRKKAEQYREKGFPVCFGRTFGYGILHTGTRLLGYDDYFTKMLLEPELIDRFSERLLEEKRRFYDTVLTELGDCIDIVWELDDLGTQRGALIDPELYRSRIKPFHKRLFAFIKEKAPHIKILFHSCGSIREVIPDLIEIGADILNPVQTNAEGMDPEGLKREFGSELTFWGGGIETQTTLPNASVDEIKDTVRKRVEILGRGGGFVFATVHTIQDDVPPEHILALFEALDEYR
jgi:uroporphyrinogen decarboxylase